MNYPKRFGTIGRSGFYSSSAALMMASALMLATRRKPRTLTEEDAAKVQVERDKRSERQRWNDEVAAKKAAKKARP